MKKYTKIIFSILLVLTIGFFAQAQSDSTNLQATEQFNDLVETIILPAVFSILGATGINVTPFAALITFVVMFLIRRYEKNNLRKKITKEIVEIMDSPIPPNADTLNEPYKSKFQKFIDKLRGKK